MDWSPQQTEALKKIGAWWKRANAERTYDAPASIFRLFGYAGTGKTTIAKELRNMVPGEVRFATFTGKAALVLHNKGCEGASTIHRMIYRTMDKSKQRYEELKNELVTLRATPDSKPDDIAAVVQEISRLEQDLKQPGFTLNHEAFTRAWDEERDCYVYVTPPALIVIDECSMVDEKMGRDLCSFGIPILVLGDPAQLPPIKGDGYFTGGKRNPITPDFLLTQIHRQAEGSPIIGMATTIRNGGSLAMGTYGNCEVTFMGNVPPETYMSADQIICGMNKTRRAWNTKYRARLGFEGFLPNVGERVICLKNNYDHGLLNGSQWKVVAVQDFPDKKFFSLTVESLDDPTLTVTTHAYKCIFFGEEIPLDELGMADSFDFGYVITCHKSQGSQWNNVVVVDEGWVFKEDAEKWRYTAITRAAEKVIVVK